MAEKKAYPLRISADVLDAVQDWAGAELRSVNAQIEYALRDALRRAGRYDPPSHANAASRERQSTSVTSLDEVGE